MIIGGPKGVKHDASMTFNAETGEIDLEHIPPDIMEIFKKAGITKKDL